MKVPILSLKPTQFAVGMIEVDEKIALAQKFSKKERRAYIQENPVPVVKGPDQQLYVVDHHHFLCVCFFIGVKKVKIDVVRDLSRRKLTYKKFWTWMLKNRKAYPFCQFGEGPRSALYLPRDIRGLADDPYRSLAWFVRKSGAFEGTDLNFAEFKWANFFREHGLLDKDGPQGMAKSIARAIKLAQSPKAKKLPGYEKLDWKKMSTAIKNGERRAYNIEKLEPEL